MWLDTLRIAKDHGTLHDLFPPGVQGLLDCPYTLFDAIRFGHIFLGFDELPEDERPPKRIWLDGEALTEWFAEVKRKRDSKFGGSNSREWDKSIDDPVDNAAAKGLIVG